MLAVIINAHNVNAKPGLLLRTPHRLQLWQATIANAQTQQHQHATGFAGAALPLTRWTFHPGATLHNTHYPLPVMSHSGVRELSTKKVL